MADQYKNTYSKAEQDKILVKIYDHVMRQLHDVLFHKKL